jgi:hypothetical protein
MIHTQFRRHALQLALAVHNTSGTDVVALRKEQLNHHLSVLLHPFGLRHNNHTLLHLRDTGGHQLGIAFHFNQAKPATASIGQTIQATKGGNIDPGILSRGQHTLRRQSADHFIVNGKSDNL